MQVSNVTFLLHVCFVGQIDINLTFFSEFQFVCKDNYERWKSILRQHLQAKSGTAAKSACLSEG